MEKEIFEKDNFKEICLEGSSGSMLYVLINGEYGWLMYLRYKGDAGFSSRNLDFENDDTEIEFLLSNGQLDHYPISWTLPIAIVEKAILYFEKEDMMPPFITWHEDGY